MVTFDFSGYRLHPLVSSDSEQASETMNSFRYLEELLWGGVRSSHVRGQHDTDERTLVQATNSRPQTVHALIALIPNYILHVETCLLGNWKIPSFMKLGNQLSSSRKPLTRSCPEPDKSGSHSLTLFIHLNIILPPIYSLSPTWSPIYAFTD